MKNNKMTRKLIPCALALACVARLTVPAFAIDMQPAAENSATTIPVKISAEATTFSVTVPTAFPTTVDPVTGETTSPDTLKITNNSAAPIVVSQIKVTKAADWVLGAFDADLRNADVDANIIGVSVQPAGGRSSGAGGTALKTVEATTDALKAEQVILAAKSDEWVIDAANATDTDELSIHYDTNATPVSAPVTEKTVANIVITVSWNK